MISGREDVPVVAVPPPPPPIVPSLGPLGVAVLGAGLGIAGVRKLRAGAVS